MTMSCYTVSGTKYIYRLLHFGNILSTYYRIISTYYRVLGRYENLLLKIWAVFCEAKCGPVRSTYKCEAFY